MCVGVPLSASGMSGTTFLLGVWRVGMVGFGSGWGLNEEAFNMSTLKVGVTRAECRKN